ncbi:MAG: hypothetical protein ABIR24_05420 [Verrucomicrobiota bacterium]
MKPNLYLNKNQGSVLLVTLVITGILGVTLASYLSLVGTQNRSVARSQTWNASIPMTEAGIEEAIVHLNRNCVASTITSVTPNWTADGWTAVADGYQMTRSLGDGSYTVTLVTVAPYSTSRPAIVSEGRVPAPFAYSTPTLFFATIGTVAQSEIPYVARKVRATTGQDGAMAKGMVAEGQIDLAGNNVSSDSFDSEDPAFSTLGQYDSDPLKTKDNGDIATNSRLVDSLNAGNANVSGHVSTGPGGSVSIGPNGKVGDKAWMADSTKVGIQPGYSTDDMNVSFEKVKIPFTGGYSTPTGDTLTITNITSANTTNTSAGYPTGSGTVYTNTVTTTTTSHPSSGSYLGTVNTNTGYVTTTTYPAASTYVGIVATNTASQTTTGVPAAGTYLGSVVTNTSGQTSKNYPAAGTYVGTVTTNYNGNNGSVRSYSYQEIASYTVERITGYSYAKILNYTYARITGYNLVQSILVTNIYSETYDYILDGGRYQLSALSGKVLVRGEASLYVTGDVSLTGNNDKIQINPGASLKMYVGGSDAKIGGLGVVNKSGYANNFHYYGLPTNTKLAFNGNGHFTGVVYAPQADFTLGGGGKDWKDFIGASISKTVKMNGHFNFHYDEALARKGPSRGYVITSWNEIRLDQTK